MNLRKIGVVYRKELIDSLRDRRTLISMIVIPLLLMPLLTIGMGLFTAKMMVSAMQETSHVMVIGGEDSPRVMSAIRTAKLVALVPAAPDYIKQVSKKKVGAAVVIPKDFDASLERNETMTVPIYMYEGEFPSQIAADRMDKALRDLGAATVRERLAARHVSDALLQPINVEQHKVGSSVLAGLIPYLVILLSITGAMYPATDLTAGEKERGTMETILCSPVSRTDLVLGKFLVVTTTALATSMLAVLAMGFSFLYAKSAGAGMPLDSASIFQLNIDAGAVIAVFAMVLPLVMFFSAVLLTIALFAKSYKEAQSYLSPLMIVVILPAVMSMMPGVELNMETALVPILNTSLVSKEIVTGTYPWEYIFFIFGSSTVYAAIALAVAVKLFNREDVLFRA